MSVASNSVFAGLLPHLPLYLVWLAGIIVALARWRRHPRASLLVVIAIAVFIVNAMAGVAANLWMQQVAQAARMPWRNGLPVAVQMTVISIVRNVIEALLAAVGYGLLIGAAFASRQPKNVEADVPTQTQAFARPGAASN